MHSIESMGKVCTIGIGVGEDRNGCPVENTYACLKAVKAMLAERHDGYTITETDGGWTNDAGRLVEEPGLSILLIVHYATPVGYVRDTAERAARIFNQAAAVVIHPYLTAELVRPEYADTEWQAIDPGY